MSALAPLLRDERTSAHGSWFTSTRPSEMNGSVERKIGLALSGGGLPARSARTDGQTTENQRRELEAVAARSGWEVVGIYEDAGISGAKGRDKRPGFDRLLKDATARKIDMVAAWSVDRLGRSLQHLVGLLM